MFMYSMDVDFIHLFVSFIYFISSYFILLHLIHVFMGIDVIVLIIETFYKHWCYRAGYG